MKALLLDCGGVLVAPVHGDWLLPPGHEAILGEDFRARHLDSFRAVRGAFLHLLPDTNQIATDEEECAMFVPYFGAVLAEMGIDLPREALERLAWLQVYQDARYLMFEDVLPYLDKWRQRYRLGIVSDAPPSTRRIVDAFGIGGRMHGATYSCEIGTLKPHPSIYLRTLAQLGVAPEDAVFVDDLAGNLHGAQRVGIRAVQMQREMPAYYAPGKAWDGPIVHDFAELDALLARL